MAEPIVIDLVSSNKIISQQMLDNCYFYEMEDDTFSLFSAANVLLKDGLKTGQNFSFDLGPFNFGVTKFEIAKTGGRAGKGQAKGQWEANRRGLVPIKPLGPGDADDEGSFQAQAGGHGLPEQSAAAGSSY